MAYILTYDWLIKSAIYVTSNINMIDFVLKYLCKSSTEDFRNNNHYTNRYIYIHIMFF